jgi:hypothetical protein
MISSMAGGAYDAQTYCDVCWRVERTKAGALMMEGPITWGESWSEVEEWLTRTMQSVSDQPNIASWRRLIAADLQRQIVHLAPEIPSAVREFLREFGEAAG